MLVCIHGRYDSCRDRLAYSRLCMNRSLNCLAVSLGRGRLADCPGPTRTTTRLFATGFPSTGAAAAMANSSDLSSASLVSTKT